MHRILDAHPLCRGVPETHIFRKLLLKEEQSPLRLSDITGAEKFSRIEKIFSAKGERSIECALSYFELLEPNLKLQNSALIEKDPRLIEHIPKLVCDNAAAMVVVMRRDPLSILSSKMEADWSKKKGWFVNLIIGFLQSQAYRTDLQSLSRGQRKRVIEVKYEHLVRDSKNTIDQLCLSLGMDPSCNMYDHASHSTLPIYEDESQWKQNLSRPIASYRDRYRLQAPNFVIHLMMVLYGSEVAVDERAYDQRSILLCTCASVAASVIRIFCFAVIALRRLKLV